MPDVGSKNGAISKLVGMADNLQRTMIKDRFGKGGLFTMSTKNTTKTCPICFSRGHSFGSVGVEHEDGSVRMHHCPACKGTRELKI